MRDFAKGSMSRRGFVAGMGAAAAAASGTVLAFADEAAGIEWDGEAEILVVGAGCAGLNAAIVAQDAGASVLVLEKTTAEMAGGDTVCFGGINTGASAAQMKAGGLGQLSDEECALIEEETNYVINWFYEESGLEYNGFTAVGSGRAVYDCLVNVALEKGVETIYESPMTSLIQNQETGEVIGVACGDKKYHATRGVIVTTGGYESNADMVQAYHYPGLKTVSCGHPSITGDGIVCCQAAGAGLSFMGSSIHWFEFAFAEPSRLYGTGICNRQWATSELFDLINIEKYPSKVFVNMNGDRFMDESRIVTHDTSTDLPFFSLDGSLRHPLSYKNMPMFLICDDDCLKSGPLGRCPADDTWTYTSVYDVYRWSDDNQAEVEAGWLIKADSIAELAEKLSASDYLSGETLTMNVEELEATIAAYNEACASGVDEFGRPQEYMKPIVTPPFYAAEMMPCIVYTVSGVKTNGASQVLRDDDTVVPRLYAAGNVGQGRAWGATGAGTCMARARIAAKHILGLE